MTVTYYTDRAIHNARRAIDETTRPPKFTAAADVTLTPSTLRTKWPEILRRLDPPTRALASKAKPWKIDGNRLYLRCDGVFYADMLNHPHRRRRIIDAITRETGQTLNVGAEYQQPYPPYRPDVPEMTSQALWYIGFELNRNPRATRREYLKTEACNINIATQTYRERGATVPPQ